MNPKLVGEWALELVTPDDARMYLSKMLKNRTVKQARVILYARQIDEGRFAITHQGIAFNEEGELCDGQHRLHAVIKANKPITTWVYRAVSIDTSKIDGVLSRTIADQSTMSGADMTAWEQAVITRMVQSVSNASPKKCKDVDFMVQFHFQHHMAISFASSLLLPKVVKFSSSIIGAVIARAWYTATHDRLAEFVSVLRSGETRNVTQDRAAIRLRDYILSDTNRKIGGSQEGRTGAYRKIETALAAFVKYKPLDKIYECSRELFPIEGDDEYEKTEIV